jgi:hypothetical protein
MLVRFQRLRAASAASLALVIALGLAAGSRAFASAPALTGGDRSATVTVGGRPLSADTDHVVAFERDKTLYVCVKDLKQMASGSMSHDGATYTLKSFKGDSNSRTFVFSVGSSTVTASGKPFVLSAPVVRAYGHLYVPLSFFGSGAVRTHVKISPDGRTGDIILPPGEM